MNMDFFFVKVTSKTIRPMIKAGIKREDIRGQQKWTAGHRYPEHWYESSFYPPNETACMDLAHKLTASGLSAQVKYHCVD